MSPSKLPRHDFSSFPELVILQKLEEVGSSVKVIWNQHFIFLLHSFKNSASIHCDRIRHRFSYCSLKEGLNFVAEGSNLD